jgi:hypothetical protein
MKTVLLFACCLLFSALLRAQEFHFLSRIYFPNSYGLNITSNSKTFRTGFISTAGIEYRLKDTSSFFFRISYTNCSHKYSVKPGTVTNISSAKIHYAGVLAGFGYRKIAGKWGYYGLVQPGIRFEKYPRMEKYSVNGTAGSNAYTLIYRERGLFAARLACGLEYYITRSFVLITEPEYIITTGRSPFWKSPYHNGAFTIGFTTSLF